MTFLGSKNGYTLLPTIDSDVVEGAGAVGDYGGVQYGPHRDWNAMKLNSHERKGSKKSPINHRPGLFYMFGDRLKYAANHVSVVLASQSESECDAERIELTEIRSKRPKFLRRGRIKSSSKTPKPKTKVTVIEEPVQPGDTVQRVALRYNCPTSEIKRVNNLYCDQDFYALNTVKIPIKEHGILTEPQARENCRKNQVDEPSHSSGGATSDDLRLGGPSAYYRSDDEEYLRSSGDADDEVGDSDSPDVRDVSIQSALKWKHSQHALLEKFDAELQRVRDNTEQRLANLGEVAITMTTPTIQPISTCSKKNSFETNLFMISNCDWRLIMVMVVIIVIAVILYLWIFCYIKERKITFCIT